MAATPESLKLVPEEDVRALILGLARGTPEGFTRATAVRLLDRYERVLIEHGLFQNVIRGDLNVRWQPDMAEPTFGQT